jgi:hypothetical protein
MGGTGIGGTGKVGLMTGCETLGSTGIGGTGKVVDSVILEGGLSVSVGWVIGSEVLGGTEIRGTGKVGVVIGCEVKGRGGSGGTSKIVGEILGGGMSPT